MKSLIQRKTLRFRATKQKSSLGIRVCNENAPTEFDGTDNLYDR